MDIAAAIVDFVFNAVILFFGFIAVLIVLAIIFGKRVEKKWEFEANFRNDRGREIGEFDIEMKRYPKEEEEFRLVAKMFLKHDSLRLGRTLEVLFDDLLVMRGEVTKVGSIRLGNEHLLTEITDPKSGQMCVVKCEGHEIFREPLRED